MSLFHFTINICMIFVLKTTSCSVPRIFTLLTKKDQIVDFTVYCFFLLFFVCPKTIDINDDKTV